MLGGIERHDISHHSFRGQTIPKHMLSWVAPCGFTTPLSCELRRLGFSLPLHCSALFNHGQVTPFIVYIAAFGRFMRRSRIPKHSRRHIYSRCEVRSCGAVARAQTIGVEFRAVTFRTRVYSWTRRTDGHGGRIIWYNIPTPKDVLGWSIKEKRWKQNRRWRPKIRLRILRRYLKR